MRTCIGTCNVSYHMIAATIVAPLPHTPWMHAYMITVYIISVMGTIQMNNFKLKLIVYVFVCDTSQKQSPWIINKGNNNITELRTILQRESKTHNYIDRQNQSTTGKLWKPYWPWLGTDISKDIIHHSIFFSHYFSNRIFSR